MTNNRNYKNALDISICLESALKMECQKLRKSPVKPDLHPSYELAQAWGYVVAAYSLIEQGFKAILHFRELTPTKTHTLSALYCQLPENDKSVLNDFYNDFLHSFPGMAAFPKKTLEQFLVNLDGLEHNEQMANGSIDWRYFLTELASSHSLPLVSINIMHEIVYGCLRLIDSIEYRNRQPLNLTYSMRLRRQRQSRYRDWLTVRMNSPDWDQIGNRIEILWGPDHKNRYDFMVHKNSNIRIHFGPHPSTINDTFPIVDKRHEVKHFDMEAGFKTIGIVSDSLSRGKVNDSDSHHFMF